MPFHSRLFLYLLLTGGLFVTLDSYSQNLRPRESGLKIGHFPTGEFNAITDVVGVLVGQVTLNMADSIRTGVTAVLPHNGNLFEQKVPAAVYVGNGFGKLTGISQIRELGNIETPIILTNTLSVPTAADALITYTLQNDLPKRIRSVNGVVGETNDGWLNDIRGRHVRDVDVLKAISTARPGPIAEGNVGAGTGTVAFGFKGGIGTASRVLPREAGEYTVGVLVQTNFGGNLTIGGVVMNKLLGQKDVSSADGSCMIIVATDAPISERNLERMAKRAVLGLARTGGIASNGSGDYVIAFSTARENRISMFADARYIFPKQLMNDQMTPLFDATIEATEEAIINSLFMASSMEGRQEHFVPELPEKKVLDILRTRKVIGN